MVVEKFGKTKKEKWAVIKTGTVAAVPKAGAAVPKAGDPGIPPRPPAEPPKPRTKTAVEESTAKATATKAEYDKVVRKADTIMESMQTDVAYAKEKRAYKELMETAQKAVKTEIGKDPFYQAWLLKDVADVKRGWKADEVSSKCNSFVANIKAPLAALSKMNKEILGVVRARETAEQKGSGVKAQPKKKQQVTGDA